ncbi:MAG: hypothetical protein GF344_17770 [Chitinivibrionales bacterium]|nr:hypothetical protein [Chitinivibrionales bacterium]MBD3358514.1 hypothetical protein [Chitinivibrionales bacterium]
MSVIYALAVSLFAVGSSAVAQAPSAQRPYASPYHPADSLLAGLEGDTTLADSGSVGIERKTPPPAKLKVVERNFSYRRQVGMALGMMAFLALIFTTTQGWNPD